MHRHSSYIIYLLAIGTTILGQAAPNPTPPPFPKDHPGAMYPDLKIYDAQKNPIRVPKEDWDAVKARVATDPAWAKWVDGQKGAVDNWMAMRQDKVEWIAGWFHDFVSPKDASELEFTPDEPGPKTLHSKSDPEVELTPKLHAGWVFFFRERHADKMLDAARLYRITGDKKYADWAAQWLDFYADNLTKWDIHQTNPKYKDATARLMWQALDEAVIMITYVQTARTLGDYVTPERKQHWIDALFKPEAELLQSTRQSIHNIGCWQRSAAAVIALYAKDDALWKRAVDDPNGVHDQIARGVTSDYLWFEQSLHYNSFVVMALTPLFTYAQQEGRGGELQEDMETIEDLMLTPAEMRFPNGQLPNPADGGRPEQAPDDKLWRNVAPLFPTKVGVWSLAHEKSWAALIYPPDPATVPTEEPTLPPVISRSFESSQMAILRSGPWQVYFHYGQITASHSQSEALNFEAFYKDTDVSHDPGSVGYGAPMFKEYYETGICHNVPLVDGEGEVKWNAGKLNSFSETSVTASQPNYQPTAHAERTLAIEGEALKDSVHIATMDGKPHALGFALHFMGKAQRMPVGFIADAAPAEIQPVTGFKYWTNISRAVFHDKVEFDVKCKGATIHAVFELPGEFTVWHASAPELLPTRRDVFYLETHGQEATLKTTLTGTPKTDKTP